METIHSECSNYSIVTNTNSENEEKIAKVRFFQDDIIIFPLETAKQFVESYRTLTSKNLSLLELLVKPIYPQEVIMFLEHNVYRELEDLVNKNTSFIQITNHKFYGVFFTEEEFNDLIYFIINYDKKTNTYNDKYIECFEKISCSKLSAVCLKALAIKYINYRQSLKSINSSNYKFNKIFSNNRNYKPLKKVLNLAFINKYKAIKKLQKLEISNYEKFKKLFLDLKALDITLK